MSTIVKFLLTPLREGRPASGTISVHVPLFLLTPLREGRPVAERGEAAEAQFLLTPLREGRPAAAAAMAAGNSISTHAPAGGATGRECPRQAAPLISTHAPAGGATRGTRCKLLEHRYFYSRPCGRGDRLPHIYNTARRLFLLTPLREGRHGGAKYAANGVPISTHAPAGGATRSENAGDVRLYHFYSRPCGRGDETGGRNQQPGNQFLLTPLREGRRSPPCSQRASRSHFYSRPCGRGDAPPRLETGRRRNFYSRPCGRGDILLPDLPCTGHISTHAPAGGATKAAFQQREDFFHFYSRPCGRGDFVRANTCSRRLLFLLTPLREGRRERRMQYVRFENFYSRPCGRGDSKGLPQ